MSLSLSPAEVDALRPWLDSTIEELFLLPNPELADVVVTSLAEGTRFSQLRSRLLSVVKDELGANKFLNLIQAKVESLARSRKRPLEGAAESPAKRAHQAPAEPSPVPTTASTPSAAASADAARAKLDALLAGGNPALQKALAFEIPQPKAQAPAAQAFVAAAPPAANAASRPTAATTSAKTAPAKEPVNPYLAPATAASRFSRRHRNLTFFEPGAIVDQAEAQRKQARLDELKRKVEESLNKAAIKENLDLSDTFEDPYCGDPPIVEWWDAQFVTSYAGVDAGEAGLDYTAVSHLVQHPVPPEAPMPILPPPTKELFLTKRELKKQRRMRKLELEKEKQIKIRAGLMAPPPPKLKISNMVRALGMEALLDPTKAEMMVKEQRDLRQEIHQKANAERKLTQAEKRSKVQSKLEQDRAKGIRVLVFRITDLTDGGHRFKVDANARQLMLSGLALLCSPNNLVIVEGGSKAANHYKKLMLNRIKWNERSAPAADAASTAEAKPAIVAATEASEPNECHLVWEGLVSAPVFDSFRFKAFKDEKAAQDFLRSLDLGHYWDSAKNFTGEITI
ncbi:hypothetical protein H696_05373 [Fonticula alba]|uniref:Uncharacterized protein n=1 Tax=Fonticula alba TaxID=691883 RepID=A0A058Z3M1_FONAL|nr:hypothetical protein H696_05373 [Fonticula alba]KCV68117.1 hypothetical protein H696_05373 [Fonticula alba]|eukprot:XP_009497491.1 hypothetical protein H696_05373 [Fonticula alba]